jgi:hypothetical protein
MLMMKITTQDPVGLPYLCVSSLNADCVAAGAPASRSSIKEGG